MLLKINVLILQQLVGTVKGRTMSQCHRWSFRISFRFNLSAAPIFCAEDILPVVVDIHSDGHKRDRGQRHESGDPANDLDIIRENVGVEGSWRVVKQDKDEDHRNHGW